MANGYSSYVKEVVIDHVLRGEAWEPPEQLYFALLTKDGDSDGSYREVQASEYKRQPIKLRKGSDGSTSNVNDLVFPIADSAWGTVVALGIFDRDRGGKLLFSSVRSEPVDVIKYMQLEWPTGSYRIVG